MQPLKEKFPIISRLPYSLRILLENTLRCGKDGDENIFVQWLDNNGIPNDEEISFFPSRVLLQDFTGVPAIVDLAAMRNALSDKGLDPRNINPVCPVDVVVDHSLAVDYAGRSDSISQNEKLEVQRNSERYRFLKWASKSFNNLNVIPPGSGICHQINLEYLSKVIRITDDGITKILTPDSLVGADSHTTMVNGVSVLGWGVGGIEAESVMLGQPITLKMPKVTGVKLTGKISPGMTTTDMVLTITQMLRKLGVVGQFVEFFGDGITELSIEERATISNMAPEYGATCAFFPIDQNTIQYLNSTGRPKEHVDIVEQYAKDNDLWYADNATECIFSSSLEIDLNNIESSIAGPSRPQDRFALGKLPTISKNFIESGCGKDPSVVSTDNKHNNNSAIKHGDIVLSSITSCTNTSNPLVMIAAGILAKKAVERGLSSKKWIKTSFTPGSKVVSDYLAKSKLQYYLDKLGFNVVGYGCATCIGNSGSLDPDIESQIVSRDLIVSSVLSGNRNFEGRINPHIRANYLASPPLCVAFALAGTTMIDIQNDVIAFDNTGGPVFLKELWPSMAEIRKIMEQFINREAFLQQYSSIFEGNNAWRDIHAPESYLYPWEEDSRYIRMPTYFQSDYGDKQYCSQQQNAAYILCMLGDSVTTDHISPAGKIHTSSAAAEYLRHHGINDNNFNSYGARRGNHEVMIRGTFANQLLNNRMSPNKRGGYTLHIPSGTVMNIFDASEKYKAADQPMVIIAGKEYGCGSSRDWAAKGTKLLGVKAVIAESFERIHRSNLVGMGVVPYQFCEGVNQETLNLSGREKIILPVLGDDATPGNTLPITIIYEDKREVNVPCICRIDTNREMQYIQDRGILMTTLNLFS